MNPQITCKLCSSECSSDWAFCPKCGKPLKDTPPNTSLGKQLLIYAVSFFLAPFGLVWGISYLRSKDKKARIVGIVAILLTILAIGSIIGSVSYLTSQYAKILNDPASFYGL